MKRKIEEQMAMLAFGEVSAEEALRLKARAELDPEAERAYGMYCRMKDELRSLSDVPADQLSKERLRQAILARGLKDHQPRRERPTWLWMPAAAAAMAFGLMFVKGQMAAGRPVVTAVVDQTHGKDLPGLPSFEIERPLAGLNAKVQEQSAPIHPQTTTVAMNTVSASRRHRESDTIFASRGESALNRGIALASVETPDDFGKTDAKAFESPAREAFGPSAPPATVLEGNSTIVVIQSETDLNTGTNKAKEVQDASNVVIGG